ncbi:MAG: LamG domain-containing protein, partial [Verrucomicrobiales bacterium]|nr:LamG domain-containing protein [Verrucomicrobiales bacterium]
NGFQSGLTAFGSNNKVGLSPDFTAGPLGRCYIPRSTGTLTNLFNAGSRTAAAAGLYHFTTTPDGAKELGSVVDIGYHYPATATAVNWNGLLAHWRLDDGTGSVATDSSPNGFNGTLVNSPSWAYGPSGGALSFPATARVNVPDSPALRLTNALTIAMWALKGNETEEWRLYLGKQAGTLWNYSLYDFIGTDGRSVFQYMDVPNSYPGITSVSHTPVGQWTHIAATWTGTEISLYINGILDSTIYQNKVPATGTEPLYFGLTHSIAGTHLLDEVSLHNRALSASEIWNLSRLSPIDTDGDGLLDILEDTDGDGVADAGESDWTTSLGAGGGPLALLVHTPLRP